MAKDHGVLSFKDLPSRVLTKLVSEDACEASTGRSTILRQIVVGHYRKNGRLKDADLHRSAKGSGR
jgi:hypothetical protein